jgi:hypothetical protein
MRRRQSRGHEDGLIDGRRPRPRTDAKSDGVLAGMKGTTPLVDLGDEFKTAC